MANSNLEFFIYDHDEREFNYFDGDRNRLEDIMTAESPDEISEELDYENIDGMLVLDEDGGRWYLAFSSSLGIVGQRTARRQADTIVRSGFTLPDGYWLQAKYPMEELNDPNIGDLWQSVQQKYVKSDLPGMGLDRDSGIPSQLADRAKTLEKEGLSDELAEAKFEKEEAEERKKAEAKSSKKKSPKKKSTKKKSAKETSTKTTKKSSKKKEEPSKKKESVAKKGKEKAKKETKSKAKKGDNMKFFEINNLAKYVHSGNTRIVAKGNLSEEGEDPQDVTLVLDPSNISMKEWNDIALFLQEGSVIQVDVNETDDGLIATSINT